MMSTNNSPQSKSDKSASTSDVKMPKPTIQSADQKSESRMKHKPHPAENTKDSDPTM